MARILVLEDMRERVDYLRTICFKDEILHTYTVKHFIEEFEAQEGEFDLIILDHDLGGPFFDSADKYEQTGQHAVDYLVHQEKRPPVLVWSVNPTGAPMMRKRLERAGYKTDWRPFYDVQAHPEYLAAMM